MKTEIIVPLNTKQKAEMIDAFLDFYQAGIDAWSSAGKIIVKLVEDDPHTYDYIIQKSPLLTAGVLQVFERIGRGLLHPPLAMDSSPGGMKLKMLPVSQQIRYTNESIPLVVHNPNGETDILLVQTKDLTRDQARQVFASGRIRTEGEQKAMLIEQRTKSSPLKTDSRPAWTIKAGRVVFHEGASLSAGELATLITQLTK